VLNSYIKIAEKKEVLKLINLILSVLLSLIIIVIWSVKQENILVVASSLLTVFGVALFAEMSILSNITACLILFFQHPIKVGDTIAVTYDGKDIEGELVDITYFFVFIKTENRGTLTIPNALLLKSSFTVIEKPLK
jgi:small-conductance mechanosensitive channel